MAFDSPTETTETTESERTARSDRGSVIDAEATTSAVVERVVDGVRSRATVRTVYGDPVTAEGRTVVPVARVVYGFGAGGGSGVTGSETVDDEGPTDETSTGGGGAVVATPLGVVELAPDGTRFVRFADRRRLGAAFLVGAALGYLFGRRARRE